MIKLSEFKSLNLGIRNPVKSSHPWIDPVTGLMDENRRKLVPKRAGIGYPIIGYNRRIIPMHNLTFR